MHRHLTLTLIASTLTVFGKPPVAAHPIEAAEAKAGTSAVVEAGKVSKPAEVAKAAPSKKKPTPEKKRPAEPTADELNAESAFILAKAKRETAELQAEISRLKVEKEHLTERLALEAMQRKMKQAKEQTAFEEKQQKLTREATIAKARAEQLAFTFSADARSAN